MLPLQCIQKGSLFPANRSDSWARWPDDAESNLKNKRCIWNNHTYPGRAHYLASLPDQPEIARTIYRFYVAPNVCGLERVKLDYVGTRLVLQAFADQNRPVLLRLLDVHD